MRGNFCLVNKCTELYTFKRENFMVCELHLHKAVTIIKINTLLQRYSLMAHEVIFRPNSHLTGNTGLGTTVNTTTRT